MPTPNDDPNRGPKMLPKIAGATAIVSILLLGCGCGEFVFWMMLGSPWPFDLAAFAE